MLAQAPYYGDSPSCLNLPQRFDVMSSAQYRIPFVKVLGHTATPRIVLNFSDVTYIDSCGVGTLLAWHKTCQEHGKELVLQNCGDKVMQVFEMLAIDRLLSIENSRT